MAENLRYSGFFPKAAIILHHQMWGVRSRQAAEGKTSAVVLSTDPVDTCKKSCGVPLLLPTSGAVSHHFLSLPVSVPVSAGFKKVVSRLHFFIFVLHEIPCYAEQTVLLERERSLEKKKEYFPTAVAAG